MSHDLESKLTETVDNPYGLPEGWVAVPLSLIRRAQDLTMDICNSHTGHCPEEIYLPQIYTSTARELNEALRNILSASIKPEGLGVRSACGGCSPESTSNYASCSGCLHNLDARVESEQAVRFADLPDHVWFRAAKDPEKTPLFKCGISFIGRDYKHGVPEPDAMVVPHKKDNGQ